MSDRFPYLCLLLLLALLPTQAFAEFQPPRIIKIINASNWGGSATGEDERLYVISKGSESNVLKGNIFNVYLEKRFTYKTAAPLRIFSGLSPLLSPLPSLTMASPSAGSRSTMLSSKTPQYKEKSP
jgi:hypothetical protein